MINKILGSPIGDFQPTYNLICPQIIVEFVKIIKQLTITITSYVHL